MTTGVLLLHGSSGTPHLDRVAVLEAQGVDVVAPQWFDGGICEIPLESLVVHLDALAPRVERLCVMGTSKGAEAALLLGTLDDRIDAVIACAPAAHVWANVGPGPDGRITPWRSSWTWQGVPLPFIPYDESWAPADPEKPSYVGSYEQSLRVYPEAAQAAEIQAERFTGDLLLTAGGDDQVWPSADYARRIVVRREAAGLPTHALVAPEAGHRVILPGENPSGAGRSLARGGTSEADRAFGLEVWPHLLRVLAL